MSSKYYLLQSGLAIAGFSCIIVSSIMGYNDFDALAISMVVIGGIAMVVAKLMNMHETLLRPRDSDYLEISVIKEADKRQEQKSVQPYSQMDNVQDSQNLDNAVKI